MDAGIGTPDLARLKGVSRKTWYENQLRRAALQEIILALSSAGVETLMLRGAIPAVRNLAAHLSRNTSDMACTVRCDQVTAALATVARLGWRPAQAGAMP